MRTRATSATFVALMTVLTACGSASDEAATDAPVPAATTDAPVATNATTAPPSEAPTAEEPSDDEVAPATEATTAPEPDGADEADERAEAAAPTLGVIDVALTPAEEAAADDPVAQVLVSAFPPGFAPPSEAQQRCVGGKIVDTIGTDRLRELGITADTTDVFGAAAFEADEVDAIVDILFECVDVQGIVAGAFAPQAGPDTADCFADYFDEELLRGLAGPFLGGGELDATVFLAQVQLANEACLPTDG